MKTEPVYLNGTWVVSDESRPVVNPATGDTFARISYVSANDIAGALDTAQKAFGGWKAETGKGRGEYLRRIARRMDARCDDIARMITLENGKPVAQSRGEVAMSIDHLEWFAEEARRPYGRVIPNQVDSKRHLVVKTPIGVVGAISPWNFPLVLAVRKVAPALAAGCPVVLKPSRTTPLSVLEFAKCVHEAELPKGVFQFLVGDAAEVAKQYLNNPICRKITFTGSTEVGQVLIAGAAKQIKPLSLELGGHAPVIVFDDADFEQAVEGVMITKFRNTGQSCIAANRIYVQNRIYKRFLEAVVDKTRALKVGNGLDAGVDVGPLIDDAGLTKALAHIKDAAGQGARVLCGGSRLDRRGGFFLDPTILADVPRGAACLREETFAPVAPICSFETEEEAVEQANDTSYGLSAYVFTRDLGRSFRMIELLEAGTIGINDPVPTTSQCPFGGMKQSGWGRELGIEGLDAFLEVKHASVRLT